MPDNMRILLADDEENILETYSFMLHRLGHYVKTASQPNDVEQLIRGDRFDIVFIDQFFGRVKGLDLMRQLSKLDPDLYYVIITANGSADLAVEALKMGASDFITKPFMIADLIKSMEYVNRKKELDRQKKAMVLTLEAKVNEKTDELRTIYFSVLSSLAQAMEKKDTGTHGHCRRVSHYSKLIAGAIGLDEKDKVDLQSGAMLHDIGKIGISDFILGKQGVLDSSEKQTVRSHPQKGVEILQPLSQFNSLLPAILHHHENYDGSGYPYALAGEAIPLPARIIAIADTYDAILSNRPYRSASNHERAMNELVRCAGIQFDPYIVAAIVREGALNAGEQNGLFSA